MFPGAINPKEKSTGGNRIIPQIKLKLITHQIFGYLNIFQKK